MTINIETRVERSVQTENKRTEENRYYIEEQALWEIRQYFGVVGTPATDSAGSIRVYALVRTQHRNP